MRSANSIPPCEVIALCLRHSKTRVTLVSNRQQPSVHGLTSALLDALVHLAADEEVAHLGPLQGSVQSSRDQVSTRLLVFDRLRIVHPFLWV